MSDAPEIDPIVDNDTTTEAPRDDGHDSEGPEAEAKAEGKNPFEDIEQNVGDMEGKMKEAGIKPEAAKGFVSEQLRGVLLKKAETALQETEKKGSKLNKLAFLWGNLSEAGKREFVNNKTGFWHAMKEGAGSSTLQQFFLETLNDITIYLRPQDLLDVEDFDSNEVKQLISLGVLDCPKDLLLTVDQDMSKLLGAVKTVLKYSEYVFPEIEPVLVGGETVAGWAQKGTGFLAEQFPAVRAEIQRQKKASVAAEVAKEHKGVAEDVKPEVKL